MKKALALVTLLCLLILSGCQSGPEEQDPVNFIKDFTAVAKSGDEKALQKYVGKTYQLNAVVDSMPFGKCLSVRCTDNVSIRLYPSEEELEDISVGEVLCLEGTVKDMETSSTGLCRVNMEPARVLGREFTVSGEVEYLYNGWNAMTENWDAEELYACFMDDSVVAGRSIQMEIVVPEGKSVEKGDTVTATGRLHAKYGNGVYLVDNAQAVVMEEPEME